MHLTALECREHAAECIACSIHTADDELRELFLRAAEDWVYLADMREKIQGEVPPNGKRSFVDDHIVEFAKIRGSSAACDIEPVLIDVPHRYNLSDR